MTSPANTSGSDRETGTVERLVEIANRDEAKTVSVSAADLRELLSKLATAREALELSRVAIGAMPATWATIDALKAIDAALRLITEGADHERS